jgi:hypothetical protein
MTAQADFHSSEVLLDPTVYDVFEELVWVYRDSFSDSIRRGSRAVAGGGGSCFEAGRYAGHYESFFADDLGYNARFVYVVAESRLP